MSFLITRFFKPLSSQEKIQSSPLSAPPTSPTSDGNFASKNPSPSTIPAGRELPVSGSAVANSQVSASQRTYVPNSDDESDDNFSSKSLSKLDFASSPPPHLTSVSSTRLATDEADFDFEQESDSSLDELDSMVFGPLIDDTKSQSSDPTFQSPASASTVTSRRFGYVTRSSTRNGCASFNISQPVSFSSLQGSFSPHKRLKQLSLNGNRPHAKEFLKLSNAKFKYSTKAIQVLQENGASETDPTRLKTLALLSELRSLNNSNKDDITTRVKRDDALSCAFQCFDGQEVSANLRKAINRTNALKMETCYRLFKPVTHPSIHINPDINVNELPQLWKNVFKDTESREQAFASGYAECVTLCQSLPDSILSWMLKNIGLEKNYKISASYRRILTSEAACKLVTCNMVNDMLSTIGADLRTDSPNSITLEEKYAGQVSDNVPSGLSNVLLLLSALAPKLTIPVCQYIVTLLVRISVDDSILCNEYHLKLVSDTLIIFLNHLTSVPDSDSTTCLKMLYNLTDSWLVQVQIIENLPAPNLSLHAFRRQLALAFGLRNSKYLTIDLKLHSIMEDLTEYLLTNSLFNVYSPETNYESLKAACILLDTALDGGFHDFGRAILSESYTIPQKTSEDEVPEKKKKFNPAALAIEAARDKQTLNSGLTRLADAIKAASTRIVDSGAQNLMRTEAKTRLELWYDRVEYSVRTAPRRKREWWSEMGESRIRTACKAANRLSNMNQQPYITLNQFFPPMKSKP